MADPFSIVAGTAGLLEICWRVGSYLGKVKAASGKIERDLAALSSEVKNLVTVNESIQTLWETQREKSPDESSSYATRIKELWRDIDLTLDGCRDVMGKLELLVEEVIGKDGFEVRGKRDGIKKVLRKQSKDEEIRDLRRQISSHQHNLQLALSALNLCYVRSSQSASEQGLDYVSEKMEYWGFKLNHELASIRTQLAATNENKASTPLSIKSPTMSAAAEIASEVSLNKHFYIPRAVSSMFTGRADQLEELGNWIFNASPSMEKQHTQKRFVVYGLGGSGKTEFCCKFAQDNRQSFWGVFWINASSRQSVQHTYSTIAQAGGVEPNERAAKDWLANLSRPWLLLIDNADDLSTPLEEHFPEGDRGVILVTTRNPLNRVHGTIGAGSYHFERLGETEANDLLLRAACEPTPWSATARDYATKITNHLGFLALAVLQAGKAIAKRICTLSNYLEVYDRSWQRIRRLRRKSTEPNGKEMTVNMNVYSSYEIIFRGLEATDALATQDAVQLIKMFSFFSWEDLRIDVLTSSVEHPRRQLEHDNEEATKVADQPVAAPRSWKQRLKDWAIWAVLALQKDASSSVLPTVLRDDKNDFDEDRLMDALDQLNQLSLIYYQEATESYSMHPLIHTWVRERPQMSTSEQALWCQAATTALSRSILLPPLDSLASAESLRRHLLPHISHVLKYQQSINGVLLENQKARAALKGPWSVLKHDFGRMQALESAKFSLIYVQNGYFGEAETLQVKTRDFVLARLGMEHVAARRITLFLSTTYGLQMRTNKAAQLQEEVLEACRVHLGPRHPETLKAMNILGTSRRFQGRFREGRILLESAIEIMKETLGPEHQDTLEAMDGLGQLEWMYLHYPEARDLYTKAVDGMIKILGPLHEKTLIAKEHLAMSCLSFEGNVLNDGDQAHATMLEVLDERKQRFGKEHPWTLYAICNLARVKSGLGDHVEAEKLIRTALPIAQRNLGENHYGTLAGTAHLGQVLVRQGRFDEAEAVFIDTIQRQRYESSARDDGEHPDRIAAMFYLLNCYQKHGKIVDAITVCEDLVEAVSTIGGQGLGLLHPFAKQLQKKREELAGLMVDRIADEKAAAAAAAAAASSSGKELVPA
ncbi:MAG: hypothetical protein Q9219_002652 [cf. Caloplaca sp. 3 TL-2023]